MVSEGFADIEAVAGVSKLSGRLLKKQVLEAIRVVFHIRNMSSPGETADSSR